MNDRNTPATDIVEVEPRRMKKIIRGLRHQDLDLQNYWMRELLAIGPAAIPYLEAALRKEYHRKSILVYFGLFIGLGTFLLHASIIADGHGGFTNWMMCGSMAVVFGLKLFEIIRRPTVKATQLTDMLVRASQGMQDPRTVCLLLDLYYFDTKAPLLSALTKMLPILRASHSALLSRTHREAMNRILVGSTDASVKIAVLNALERIGDESAIPIVEQLAMKEGGEEEGMSVSEVAREVLPLLKMRIEAANASSSLLRPADQIGDAALLRPASAAKVADETLLHSVSADS